MADQPKKPDFGARPGSDLAVYGRAIAELVGSGVPIRVACGALGIGRDRCRTWRSRARRGEPSDAPYERWVELCDLRRDAFVAEQVELVREHARGVEELTTTVKETDVGTETTTTRKLVRSRLASQWLLERLQAEQFAPQGRVEHAGEVTVRRLIVPGLPQAEEPPPADEQ